MAVSWQGGWWGRTVRVSGQARGVRDGCPGEAKWDGWVGGWTWEARRAVGRVGAAGMVVALLCPRLLGRAGPAGLLVFRCRLCECREELSSACGFPGVLSGPPRGPQNKGVTCASAAGGRCSRGAPPKTLHSRPPPAVARDPPHLHLQPCAGPAAPREGVPPDKKGAQAVLPQRAPIHPEMSLEQSKGVPTWLSP